MTGTVYQWKPRTTFNVDPQIAGEELEKIRGHNSGDLSAEAVVKSAEPKASPLHDVFEWNDAKAGHEYRLQQANSLMRAIVVTVTSEGAPHTEPLKVSVKREPRGGGAAAAKVISEEELQQRRVARGWDELAEWRKQYGELPEFAVIAAMVDGLLVVHRKAAA